jgi:hypothetical protein
MPLRSGSNPNFRSSGPSLVVLYRFSRTAVGSRGRHSLRGWRASCPSTDPVADHHVVSAVVLIAPAVTATGDTWGPGRR